MGNVSSRCSSNTVVPHPKPPDSFKIDLETGEKEYDIYSDDSQLDEYYGPRNPTGLQYRISEYIWNLISINKQTAMKLMDDVEKDPERSELSIVGAGAGGACYGI